MSEHCWHMRRAELKGPGRNGKGPVQTHWLDRCCWCGAERERITRSEPDPAHGKKNGGETRHVPINEVLTHGGEACSRVHEASLFPGGEA